MNLNGFIEWLAKQGRSGSLTKPRVRRERRGKWAVTLPGFETVHPYTFDRWADALAFANRRSDDDPGDRYALVQ